ncbi:hypothetical protein AB0L40_16445 [Patulibacter sp. NPDC049589]|uniref:hypothetical protein n=1 Tax=Patulibacter sp. NPDC049589 TaxID=3154731 RepID=UPI003446E0DA
MRVVPLRPRRTLLVLPAAVLALAAPAARGDVLLSPVVSGVEPLTRSPGPVLITPAGEHRTLAAPRIGDDDGYQTPVVSPDRLWVARTFDQRTLLLPTDGGPIRTLTTPGVPRGFRGTVWWDADATHVFHAELDDADEDAVVQRCTVATGACASFPTHGLELLGPLASGASLWERPVPLDVLDALPEGALDEWTRASPATVRRARVAVRRRVSGGLTLVAPDGRSSRVLTRTRGRYASGLDAYDAAPPAEPGLLVERVRQTYRVRTRRRHGRLELRVVGRDAPARRVLIDDAGRARPFRYRTTQGDRRPGQQPIVAAPGGWLVDLESRHGTPLVGRVSADGTVRRLTLGAAPLTLAGLHAALGLPAADAPGGVEALDGLRPVGYEAATGSAIVTYDDAGGHVVVARAPLAGGAPSLVHRGEADELLQVTAW